MYEIKEQYKGKKLCCKSGVYNLNSKLSQRKLKALYKEGHHDKIDYVPKKKKTYKKKNTSISSTSESNKGYEEYKG